MARAAAGLRSGNERCRGDGRVLGVASGSVPDLRSGSSSSTQDPLLSVVISPASSTIAVNERDVSARCRGIGRAGGWKRICSSRGRSPKAAARSSSSRSGSRVFRHPASPGLARLRLSVAQREVTCTAEALITVTDESRDARWVRRWSTHAGFPVIPSSARPGSCGARRFDAERNLIVVNNGHRDFVFATRNRALQLRYLVRLYVKELVLRNFAGLPAEQLARADDRAVTVRRREVEAAVTEQEPLERSGSSFAYSSIAVEMYSTKNSR